MARQPRNEVAGSTYHVTIHSVAEAAMVRTDRDRQLLVETLAETVTRYGWRCLGFCVLDTHYHLLVTTPEANLGRGMQYLNGTYAQTFNRRHGRRGHLFSARYWSKRVTSEAQLLLSVRFIARNAFRAGITFHPRLDRWSSYPRVIGTMSRWAFVAKTTLLEHFGRHPVAAVRRLIAFIEGRDSRPGDRRDAPF